MCGNSARRTLIFSVSDVLDDCICSIFLKKIFCDTMLFAWLVFAHCSAFCSKSGKLSSPHKIWAENNIAVMKKYIKQLLIIIIIFRRLCPAKNRFCADDKPQHKSGKRALLLKPFSVCLCCKYYFSGFISAISVSVRALSKIFTSLIMPLKPYADPDCALAPIAAHLRVDFLNLQPCAVPRSLPLI